MLSHASFAAARVRILAGRLLARVGVREESFLLALALLIGVVTAAAAVGFHSLIRVVRNWLYVDLGPVIDLYGTGLLVLILLPAAGGLAVAVISRFVFRTREGHGVVDVIESVVRTRGVIRPLSAIEKILTSGITIGSGGSAGAEGPIVQIGAGIASGIGQLFRMARQHLPILIGCGSAAGISAIFNSPIGGVFFTLEVILYDFSIRTFTPVVLASVIANVTTKAIFVAMGHERYDAIFAMPHWEVMQQAELGWRYLPSYLLLGAVCGIAGVLLTKSMYAMEKGFARLPMPRLLKPATGGAMLGLAGVIYVVVFGWLLFGRPKPIDIGHYPLPAFFSDGYGVIRQLISAPPTDAAAAGGASFYTQFPAAQLLLLLGFLCLVKVLATCLTLGSGGSGGIIAPSLFLGATAGGFVGLVLRELGFGVQPNLYALVGMGAVLAAVVHAPLASILILLELTQDYKIILPVMLAAVVATAVARMIHPDSIYTAALRLRGVAVGTSSDLSLLRRMTVEQVPLSPAATVSPDDPFAHMVELAGETGASEFVVMGENGAYEGVVTPMEVQGALLSREALPLLLVRDVMRTSVACVRTTDDLAAVLEMFAEHDVSHLPVCLPGKANCIVGLISRGALLRRYQRGLQGG